MPDTLTADESATIVAAMLDLAERGEHDAVQRLADLAKDPQKLRDVLAGKQQEQEGA